MLDLCGDNEISPLSLPDFWLVEISLPYFLHQNRRNLKVGKTVLGIGKTAVSTSPITCWSFSASFLA